MTPEAWLTVVGILAATFAALLGTKLPPVTIFLGALTLCITFHLALLERTLAGFANSGVLPSGRSSWSRPACTQPARSPIIFHCSLLIFNLI